MSSTILAKSPSWEQAIQHCESELAKVNPRSKRAEQLRYAIATFTANITRKVPWPEDESATHD